MRDRIRVKHYSLRTEDAYLGWIKRFILFHGKRHPQEMGVVEVTAFLSHLALERNVSASTQNQAKSALLFLYREVLVMDLPWLGEVVAAKVARRLPVVLTHTEVRRLLEATSGIMGLLISLLSGSGCAWQRLELVLRRPTQIRQLSKIRARVWQHLGASTRKTLP